MAGRAVALCTLVIDGEAVITVVLRRFPSINGVAARAIGAECTAMCVIIAVAALAVGLTGMAEAGVPPAVGAVAGGALSRIVVVGRVAAVAALAIG